MINIIGEDIEDRSLISLLDKMFNSRILKGSEIMDCASGVPQGNILSPLLSNIYLNTLDHKIDQIISKYTKGQYPTENKAYERAVEITEKERANKTVSQLNNLKKRKILAARRRGILPSLLDDKYIRIKYVRYADDFIVGVRGPKELAKKILEEIKTFLKSELHLTVNEEKTRITHIYSDKAKFLGMLISCPPANQVVFRKAAHVERFRRLALRTSMKLTQAERKLDKSKLKNFIQMIKSNLRSKDPTAINPKSSADLIKSMGIKEEINSWNDRGIMRKLAEELSKMSVPNKENKELIEALDRLKSCVAKNPDSLVHHGKEQGPILKHLSKRQV